MDCQQHVILIVDDEPDLVTMCQVNFELDGHVVRWADNADDAIALVRAEPPDVVLLDIELRGRPGGWSVLERLQAEPGLRDIPVLMLSAHAGRASQLRALIGGAAGYVVKPFSVRALVDRIDRVAHEDASDWRRRCAQDLSRLRAEVSATGESIVLPEGVA